MPISPEQEREASWVVKHRDRTTWWAAATSAFVVAILVIIGLWMIYSAIQVREQLALQADRDRTELIQEMRRQALLQHERTLEITRKHDREIQRQLNVIQNSLRRIVNEVGLEVDIPSTVRGSPNPSPPSSDGGPDGGDEPPDEVKPTRTCEPAGKSDQCIPQKGRKHVRS